VPARRKGMPSSMFCPPKNEDSLVIVNSLPRK
jgi:hypothetical protein